MAAWGQFNEKFPKNCSCSTKEQVSLRSSSKGSLRLFRLECRSKRFNLGFMGPENVLKRKESKQFLGPIGYTDILNCEENLSCPSLSITSTHFFPQGMEYKYWKGQRGDAGRKPKKKSRVGTGHRVKVCLEVLAPTASLHRVGIATPCCQIS